MPKQDGGLTRVLAYQAAESLKAGRLKIVLAKFEQPALPIHIVYPTSRLLSAKVRTFIDLVTEISRLAFRLGHRLPFFGTTRNVALARAITTSSALIRLCAKQIVLPVLIDLALDREPLPDLGGADEIDREPDRHQRRHAAHAHGAQL